MTNTVLLSGRGAGAAVFLIVLGQSFKDAHFHQPKLRWWQLETRHELRLQNLDHDEIQTLYATINANWPLATFIKIQVF